MKNNKGIGLIALILTIICIIVLMAIIMEASTKQVEMPHHYETEATIYVNDKYVTIDVSSYYIKNGIAYIIDSKGKEYISSNFTINKRWQVIVLAKL